MTVVVEDGLLAVARQEPSGSAIKVRLEPAGDLDAARRALDAAFDELLDLEVEEARETSFGQWSSLRVRDSIVLLGRECWEPESFIRRLAEQLEQLGVDGRLTHDAPQWSDADLYPPGRAYLLEAHTRVGHRAPTDDIPCGWTFDFEEYRPLLVAAMEWAIARGEAAPAVYREGTMAPILLDRDEDPIARMLEDPRAWFPGPSLRITHESGQRIVAKRPFPFGELSLIEILDEDTPDWQHSLADMKAVVREVSNSIVYAHIKHGSRPSYAELGQSLQWDLPQRDGIQFGLRSSQVEDQAAPDAFAFLALGPGYDGRIPATPSYRQEKVGQVTFLEHHNPAKWFDDPVLIPDTAGHGVIPDTNIPPAQVQADARAELAPILFTP